MTSIKCEKGATLVEFVLVLPLLLLFTFAIIEFGVLMYDKAMITLGSREGARAAIVWRPSSDFLDKPEITTEVDHFLGVDDENPDGLLISFGDETTALQKPYIIGWSSEKDAPLPWPSPFDPNVHKYMNIIIKYRYDFMVLGALLSNWYPEGLTLQGETIMRMENPS